MAAYASSVTLYTPRVERISKNLGLIAGQIDITNYNSTTTEETTITRLFKASGVAAIAKGILSLQIVSSENGYIWTFVKATGKFKLYLPPAQTHGHDLLIIGGQAAASTSALSVVTAVTLGKEAATNSTVAKADVATKGGVVSETLAAAAMTQLANDVDAGTADFIAIGFIGA